MRGTRAVGASNGSYLRLDHHQALQVQVKQLPPGFSPALRTENSVADLPGLSWSHSMALGLDEVPTEWSPSFHIILAPAFISSDVIQCLHLPWVFSVLHLCHPQFQSCIPWEVHPACISGGSGGSGFLWEPPGMLRGNSGGIDDWTSLGPFAEPLPLCSQL